MTEGSQLEKLALTILEAKRKRESAEMALSTTPTWRFRQRIRRERNVELHRAREQELLALLRSVTKRPTRPNPPSPELALDPLSASAPPSGV